MGAWLGGCGKNRCCRGKVSGFQIGDLVYGDVWATNPKAGFHAEYIALNAENAWPVPSKVSAKRTGALLIDGATALRGLDDTLGLKKGEKIMVFGASGGLGHLAIQLAKRLGARVFAVASGQDGVAPALRLGAETAVDGHDNDIIDRARVFAPNGFDAGLVTVANEASEKALTAMAEGGRVAYPWINQRPPPKGPTNIRLLGYNGNID